MAGDVDQWCGAKRGRDMADGMPMAQGYELMGMWRLSAGARL